MVEPRSLPSFTRKLCFVQERVMPTLSASWKGSLPIRWVGPPRGVPARRFRADEDVAQPGEVVEGVVDREHRSARQAEEHVHALALQTLEKNPRPCEFHCQCLPLKQTGRGQKLPDLIDGVAVGRGEGRPGGAAVEAE